MKLAFLGDLHYGVRNDSEVFYNLQKQFFTEVFFPSLKENSVTNVIQVGDFFDRRQYINFKTLYYLKDYLPQLLLEYNIQMYVLIGNHDTALKSSNHINSPALLLADIPNITVLEDLCHLKLTENDEEFNITVIPWINNNNYKESIEFIANSPHQYVTGHFELKGFEMHKGHVSESGMSADIFDRFIKVISGHYHTKSDKGNILYTGTPYELTWSDWNDKKGFWILDTLTHDINFIPNPNTIYHRIEYWNKDSKEYIKIEPPTDSVTGKYVKLICVKKDDEYMFEQYLKKLGKECPIDINVVLSTIELDSTMEESIEGATKTLSQLIVENINNITLDDNIANPKELKENTIDFLLSIHTEIGGKE